MVRARSLEAFTINATINYKLWLNQLVHTCLGVFFFCIVGIANHYVKCEADYRPRSYNLCSRRAVHSGFRSETAVTAFQVYDGCSYM
jgi:hypothetical protein